MQFRQVTGCTRATGREELQARGGSRKTRPSPLWMYGALFSAHTGTPRARYSVILTMAGPGLDPCVRYSPPCELPTATRATGVGTSGRRRWCRARAGGAGVTNRAPRSLHWGRAADLACGGTEPERVWSGRRGRASGDQGRGPEQHEDGCGAVVRKRGVDLLGSTRASLKGGRGRRGEGTSGAEAGAESIMALARLRPFG